MHNHHLGLTRRDANLPTLDAIDASLRHVGTLARTLTALLPLATLAAFFLAWHLQGYWLLPLIVLAHFVCMAAYLHDVAHGSVGLSARQTNVVLFAMGAMMLQSGHAFRYTHLFHHAHCLEPEDLEGAPARLDLWQVLLAGPGYLPRLWNKALSEAAPRERRWILAELACALGMATAALLLVRWSAGPLLYCAMVLAGVMTYPLTTAYLPHHKPGARPLEQARTLRGVLVPALFMNLTYHLEHHLYPQVPSTNLRRLSLQLDPLLAARGLRVPEPLFF